MSHYEIIQLGYQLLLAALTTCVFLAGSRQMIRTIAVIFAVFVAEWFLKGWWPSSEYAVAMFVVGSLACIAITWHPAGKWQGIVGLSYILEIGVHVGRIASGENADITSYWWGLSSIAILQLFLVGGWITNDWIRSHSHRGSNNPAAAEARPSGLVR